MVVKPIFATSLIVSVYSYAYLHAFDFIGSLINFVLIHEKSINSINSFVSQVAKEIHLSRICLLVL